ncbi:MAG: cupin domain-containing protein [Proteobacteria bacterium]|jgi:quercetin dioxygenase-like cupin family protein|nr:cupin domain-containing protein [Pseudomonadota bacterium]
MNSQQSKYDLNTEIVDIKKNVTQNSSDRHTKVLAKEKDYRLVLINLKEGAVLQEHSAPGRIFVQVLEGHIHMKFNGEAVDLRKGNLVTLEANVKHEVQAVEESVFLLTVHIQE